MCGFTAVLQIYRLPLIPGSPQEAFCILGLQIRVFRQNGWRPAVLARRSSPVDSFAHAVAHWVSALSNRQRLTWIPHPRSTAGQRSAAYPRPTNISLDFANYRPTPAKGQARCLNFWSTMKGPAVWGALYSFRGDPSQYLSGLAKGWPGSRERNNYSARTISDQISIRLSQQLFFQKVGWLSQNMQWMMWMCAQLAYPVDCGVHSPDIASLLTWTRCGVQKRGCFACSCVGSWSSLGRMRTFCGNPSLKAQGKALAARPLDLSRPPCVCVCRLSLASQLKPPAEGS